MNGVAPLFAAGLACALAAAGPAQAQEREQARQWQRYVAIGLGAATKSRMDQVGSNLDTFCYPTDACFAMEPVFSTDPSQAIPGYRWRYAINADSGSSFDVAIGYKKGAWRVELGAMQTIHDLDAAFRSIEYLDGRPILPGDGAVYADVRASIGSLRTYILSASGYRDWPMGALTAYVGVGAGVAAVEVRDLRFSAVYGTDTMQAYDPPLSFYGSTQDGDFSDTVPAMLVHLGADYPLGERTQLGARLTYSHVDAITDTSGYAMHPMHAVDPDFINENTFGSTSGWQLSLVMKFALRR